MVKGGGGHRRVLCVRAQSTSQSTLKCIEMPYRAEATAGLPRFPRGNNDDWLT